MGLEAKICHSVNHSLDINYLFSYIYIMYISTVNSTRNHYKTMTQAVLTALQRLLR